MQRAVPIDEDKVLESAAQRGEIEADAQIAFAELEKETNGDRSALCVRICRPFHSGSASKAIAAQYLAEALDAAGRSADFDRAAFTAKLPRYIQDAVAHVRNVVPEPAASADGTTMPDKSSLIPEVTDEDIDWVCRLMRLDTLDQPRRAFLARGATIDVAACPGSGKTTLIVAKLAILARKWPHRSKGICVLSHTNVAREEIERCLGRDRCGTATAGVSAFHRHHSWLRQSFFGAPVAPVKRAIRHRPSTMTSLPWYRRRALDASDYWKVQGLLTKRHSDFDRLRICARDLRFDLGGKPFPAGEQSPSFAIASRAVRASAVAGYFCHDEMFVWARALLEDVPAVASWLRRRFPLVLLDEMQDTFALQGQLLHSQSD